MTPKEFIDENYFSLTIDCKREINEIYQALKDYAKIEQLTLTDVSERFALIKWIDGNPLIDGSKSFETKDKCMEYWESLPKMKDIIYTVCRIKNAR